MSIFQRLRASAAEPNSLENGLYLANVTMPAHPVGAQGVDRIQSQRQKLVGFLLVARAAVMQKMQARTISHLVRMALNLGHFNGANNSAK
jgi:FixJ family two-component response regulator